MTALTVDTPAPPPTRAGVPSPGKLAADAALKATHQTSDKPIPMWVDVTPAMAQAWLDEFNPADQRNLRPPKVAQYQRAMEREEWEDTGDPIQFGKTGVLLNGQHRLTAVVKARKTVSFLILTNVDERTRDAMDMGIKRTSIDKLAMRGYQYTAALSAVARLIWDLQTGTSNKPLVPPSDPELMAIIDGDPELVWVVGEVMKRLPKLGSYTVSAYCYLMFHRKNPEQAAYFFDKVKTPTDLPQGSPIAALINRFRDNKQGAAKYKEKVQSVGLVIAAWNAWRDGETRERIMLTAHKDGHYVIPEVK